jgi:hypothetical protein
MKVVIGMATTGDRPKELERTLKSLEGQADEIRVYDNSQERIDYTDNAKFYYLAHYKEPVYWFSLDDDIIYPPDFVSKTIEAIEEHQCIVSYHGRILRGLDVSYYHGHTALACKHTFPQTLEIDVCGTGVTAFRTDYFNPTEIYKAEDKCMSDLVFSLEATKQGKKMMHIGHKGKWIIPQDLPHGTTIYDNHHNKDKRQTEIANEIWLLKN